MRVGVLGLQGDVPEHRRALAAADPRAEIVEVREPDDLTGLQALALPGGESTTIAALIEKSGLWRPLRERLVGGLPVLATCAGLILLAKELEPVPGGRDPPTFGLLDVTVRRNDYGRQRESFEAPVSVEGLRGDPFPGVFIRAPRILRLGQHVEAVAHRGDEVVGVRSGALWGLTFHPELGGDLRLHRAFLERAARASTQTRRSRPH